MHLQAQAILLGLALVSTAQADVSHLANNNNNHNNNPGHTFVAASGQIVKQSYNPNGGASYSSKAYNAGNNNQDNQDGYWWMKTGASPFTRNTGSQLNTPSQQQNNNNIANGCTSTACTATAGTLNIKHNTQYANKRNDYSHNPFINSAKQTPQSSTNNLFKQMAQISGSPIEVNSLSSSSSSQTNQYQQSVPQNNYYQQQQLQVPRIPCHGPTQICAPKRVCSNGLIRESDLGLVLSQSKVSQTSQSQSSISTHLSLSLSSTENISTHTHT